MKTYSIFLTLVIIGYISFRSAVYWLEGMDYQELSSKESPNGATLLTHIQSMNEGSHAPYGDHLILSRRGVNSSGEGYVVFAGYCESLEYLWISSQAISINCLSKDDEKSIKTLAAEAYGIRVVFNENF
ncbi:MAG: hypothetical protein SV765_17820 [Pseudomonadota bacterium]|nr:hypothetical protein [Pseudomonadota bacterium]